jgi:PAS domain-containing protein
MRLTQEAAAHQVAADLLKARMSDGLLSLADDGTIHSANKAASRLLGYAEVSQCLRTEP